MSDAIKLDIFARENQGKGASRRLRRLENMVPGILYGGEDKPLSISIKDNELAKCMQQETFFSQLIELNLDGTSITAVLKDLQLHPAKDFAQHIDLMRVDVNKEIQVSVPLHFINEEDCKGVKESGGIISKMITQVEIICKAKNLPEYLEVDMLEVGEGDSVHLSDLKCPEGVQIKSLQYEGDEHNLTVANISIPRGSMETEEEAPAADDAAGEEGSEGKEEG